MSTYYYLLNDTKKLCIHFDNLVKEEPVTLYTFIQMAFINYMYENQGDKFRFVSEHYDETVDYKSLDLLTYNFEGYGIKEKIMRKYQRYIRSL
jgi:hypothetical protein